MTCCLRFPNCDVVESRQTLFKDDLIRLALFTCTSAGTGKCAEMLVKDVNSIMNGQPDKITAARDIKEKFEGI